MKKLLAIKTALLLIVSVLFVASCAAPMEQAKLTDAAQNATDVAPTLATLEEGEWRLLAWKKDEPVAKTINITLQYKDNRFAGVAACNRYFAGVAFGEIFGSFTISMPGSTMMMCEEEKMQAEQRFLSALLKASNYRMDGEDLYFAYYENDKLVESLIFKKVLDKK